MIIDRKKLLDSIALLMPGINKKGLIDQAEYVFFDGDNIYSNNLQVNISLPFKSDFKYGVPATELHKLLQKMTDKEIEIIENKDSSLSIKGKRIKTEIVTIPIDTSPQVLPSNNKWQKLPDGFMEAIDFCRFSAATDTMLGILTCIYINGNQAISCDNFRGTIFTMEESINTPMLLPLFAANELSKYKPIEYITDGSNIFFRNKDEVIFGCTTMKEKYRDIIEIFNIEGDEITFPANIKDTLGRTDIFAENDMGRKFMSITINENKMICRGIGSKGKIEESHRIRLNKEIEFKIQIKLLLQILDRTQQAIVGSRAILFTGDNFKHVLALVSNDQKNSK
jgi:hypothetical protein